jgi:hypothetical protein
VAISVKPSAKAEPTLRLKNSLQFISHLHCDERRPPGEQATLYTDVSTLCLRLTCRNQGEPVISPQGVLRFRNGKKRLFGEARRPQIMRLPAGMSTEKAGIMPFVNQHGSQRHSHFFREQPGRCNSDSTRDIGESLCCLA